MDKIEYRAVIMFLAKQRESVNTILQEILSVYRDSCLGKTMVFKWLLFFWDSEGIMLIDYKDKGVSITGENYASILKRLKEDIGKKKRKIDERVRPISVLGLKFSNISSTITDICQQEKCHSLVLIVTVKTVT